MTLALSVSALAAGEGSITINNAVKGQTYTIYELLYLESYNEEAKAYSYKATKDWSAFVNSAEIKGVYMDVNDQGYVTWVKGADAAAFAKLAQAYAAEHTIENQGSVTATGTKVEFKNLELGYYLVDSTLGTLCSLDTTNPAADIREKNAEPTNVKEVQEDGNSAWGNKNDADIGQTVNFKSTITAQAGAENYVFHDKMSSGLTYTGVTSVTLNDNAVDAANYTVKTTGMTDDCTFEVVFTQTFCNTLKANDKIVISYTATVNEDAVIGGNGNPNESKVEYGESGKTTTTPPSTTTTYTWKVDVLKYAEVTKADSSTKEEKPLSGAVFTLSRDDKGTDLITLIKVEKNVYRVAKTDETGITEITTDETGAFTIEGLDSDTYYLIEKTAPAGYNTLKEPVTITISPDGKVNVTTENPNGVDTVKVLNQSGTELPSTGGMGTTIFYVLGGVLMAGAFVLLVVRKRMRTE